MVRPDSQGVAADGLPADTAGDLRAVLRQAPEIIRAAGLGDCQLASVTRLRGGSKKGVYRLACDDGFSAVLYVWSAAEDYWPAEPDSDETGVFAHASGIDLFEASGRQLDEAGVRIPRTYLLDRSQAVYPADIVLAEDVTGATLERLLETDPGAALPVIGRLGAMLSGMWRQRADHIGKVAGPADDAHGLRCEQIVLDRALRQLARAADRVPRLAEARQAVDRALRARAAAIAPRAEYTLIHGELGPDHVLIDNRGQPVIIDIEGAMYFDAEWEHAFLRLRFGRHYESLRVSGLDPHRMDLYSLALDLSLIEGPLRLLDGGYRDRGEMLAIVGRAVERALGAANARADLTGPGRRQRGDGRVRDGFAVRGVAEGGGQALPREDPREPLPGVVPHAVEGQRGDREPPRADLIGLGRLARPGGAREDHDVHVPGGARGKQEPHVRELGHGTDRHVDARLLFDLPRGCLRRRLARLHVAAKSDDLA
jgi:hypothetical protein